MAHMRVAPMEALPARRADERVVVKRGDHRNATRTCQGRQIERKIEEVVDVNHVRPDDVQGVAIRWPISGGR